VLQVMSEAIARRLFGLAGGGTGSSNSTNAEENKGMADDAIHVNDSPEGESEVHSRLRQQIEALDVSRLNLQSALHQLASQPYSTRLKRGVAMGRRELQQQSTRIARTIIALSEAQRPEVAVLVHTYNKIAASVKALVADAARLDGGQSPSELEARSDSPVDSLFPQRSSKDEAQLTALPDALSSEVLSGVAQRREDLLALNLSVKQMKEMFDDLQEITDEQQKHVDEVETRVESAKEHTLVAEKELRKAASLKSAGFVVAAVAAGAVIGGPAGAILGAKTALGTVGGAMALSFSGGLLGFGFGKTMAAVHRKGIALPPETDGTTSSSSSSSVASSAPAVSSSLASTSRDAAPLPLTALRSRAASTPSPEDMHNAAAQPAAASTAARPPATAPAAPSSKDSQKPSLLSKLLSRK
jgi:hypothetical protein